MSKFIKWLTNTLLAFTGIEYKEIDKEELDEFEEELIVVKEPHDFNGSKEIVDELNNNKIVVFNLDNLSKDEARRILDFVSGAAYVAGYKLRSSGKMLFTSEPKKVFSRETKVDNLGKQRVIL